MNSLAIETGVNQKTIAAWLSVLETSFIVFRLHPYHKNYNKRIIKMPKLYFYDTGLASALLGIEDPSQLEFHPFRGSLFENLVIIEFLKHRLNRGKSRNLYFWRDTAGNEIDLLIEQGAQLLPIDIKSGMTVTANYFKGLKFWNKLSDTPGGLIVYGGSESQKRSDGIIISPLSELNSLL